MSTFSVMHAAAAAAVLVVAGCGEAPDGPAVEDAASGEAPSAALERIADGFIDLNFERTPELAYFGYADLREPDHARLSDISPAAQARYEAAEDALLAELEALDPDALETPADWVLYVSLLEEMTASTGVRVCQRELWSLNHMWGWQTALPRVADAAPVETAAQRAAALERWRALPDYITTDTANLRDGLAQGYSAPKSVVRRVIAQLDALLAVPVEASPFAAPARKADGEADFVADVHALVDSEINPAIRTYRDFLETEYLPAARDSVAIDTLPDGAACYAAYLRLYTSLPRTAQETHDLGARTVAGNRETVIALGEPRYGTDDFTEILARNNAAPGNQFASEAELVDYSRAVVERAREAVAPLFAALPEQAMVVEPIPDFLRGTGQSSSYQSSPPEDGPGTYRIASDNWQEDTRGGAEITAAHEGWPGHHLQIATAYGLDGLHPAVRMARVTAYVEGWARYSEALAEEAGVYSPEGYAQITRRAWPARGMVVDPGLHRLGWSRQQAADFLIESGRFTQERADDMIDRIAVIPGQLTAYDTGGLEIFALRAEAEERLGERFDIRDFHARILENGALPLLALREKVHAWIDTVEAEDAATGGAD
jgi:uncharacterized protein (DUF885 family)